VGVSYVSTCPLEYPKWTDRMNSKVDKALPYGMKYDIAKCIESYLMKT